MLDNACKKARYELDKHILAHLDHLSEADLHKGRMLMSRLSEVSITKSSQ